MLHEGRQHVGRPGVGPLIAARGLGTPEQMRLAQRVSARSSVALGRLLPLRGRQGHAPMRALSIANGTPLDETTPSQGVDDQTRARKCLHDLAHALRFARSPEQLATMWSILSEYKPVVVANGFVRPVSIRPVRFRMDDAYSPCVRIPADSFAVRVVSASVLRLLVKQGKRHTVVEKLPAKYIGASDDESASTGETPDSFGPHDKVLLVSEKVVARQILSKLWRWDCHLEFVQFLEAYEAKSARRRTLTRSPADVGELSALDDYIHALYLESLYKLHEHAKMLEQFQLRGGRDLIPFLFRYGAIRKLLFACMIERNGRLARDIVDQALDHPTLSTFTISPFTLAVGACLSGDRTLERLQHAMHIYRRMRHEAGYVLQPDEWSSLIHACISLGQHEYALEVFREYRVHGIPAFQWRFQQAIRTACRQVQYDMAIDMVQTWIAIEQEQQHECLLALNEDGFSCRRQELEGMSLNNTLWEMLNGSPSRDQVEQVLFLMQTRRCEAGAPIIRRVMAHHFESATEGDADAVVSQFSERLERVPNAIRRTAFVLHLAMNECVSRGWHSQYEHVLEYAKANKIKLPFVDATKLMEHHAARGAFDVAIQVGERVMLSRLDTAKRVTEKHHIAPHQLLLDGIPDAFFVCLLQCYVSLGRFEDVALVDDAFELTARRSEANAALAEILCETATKV